ncbi:MAG: hypothetical protein CM15mP124_1690 [Alphaproteobacteria bacterium]|nr:MAG: hypothetical protein CM15mP124_1690 [Alphaproteobacteria bacterium]|tara:strand:+ start:608 stop:784 length:177 start_codon:yes stop_codon:yes gene_type:complete
MSDEQRWTDKIDNEILEWVLNNSDSIETITPRMLIKIIDIKQSEPDRWKEMSNIKFGV